MKFIDKNTLSRFGVTGVQIGALFYLKQHPGSSMKQMAEMLHLDKSAISGLIRRLEKLAMVKREDSEIDGRSVVLFLTELGSQTVSAVIPFLIEFNKSIEDDFTESELATITRYLERMSSLNSPAEK